MTRIQASDYAMGRAVADLAQFAMMRATDSPGAYPLKSGAVAYWQGGDGWFIGGTAPGGVDIHAALTIIDKAMRGSLVVCSHDPRH